MRIFSALLLAALGLPVLHAKSQQPCASTVVGHLDIVPFHDMTFGRNRNLRVWLPPGYDSPQNAKKRYSVLYMFDGQWLFDKCTSEWKSEWQIDETLTDLIGRQQVEPIVVVGIDNAGPYRSEEYEWYDNPIPSQRDTMPSLGSKIPEFMDEVLPWIESRYRVKAGPGHTAIGGSSFGGLAALRTLLHRPEVFGLGLLESTSLQDGNGLALRDVSVIVRGPRKISLGVGTAEANQQMLESMGLPTANEALVKMHETLADSMRHSMMGKTEVKLTIAPGGQHTEAAWAARFPDAVRFLFPPVP
ncbi:alpha/beta hydrolase [Terriglobus sp. TAA 43]|uniref:alpha/beta hydrolase n=1 Tax=Terriglobus sp. TAA 43 TaxID=278961 RepID=UPI00068A9DF8|nr:alpha/beta hydrolase-fold protein [Terriglobus sp. TAA 43]